MALSTGIRLGPYEIRAAIGAGGMGEVYRATDTKLKRDVALKVLPAAFVKDSDRMARFGREAQMLAALNHPNIAAIYGVEESGGVRALVMELVEGPTLADRIAGGAIPIEESLVIARQIAEALEYAHEKGVIHRDLKPANVKVTLEGVVKVLDFGLAKAVSDDQPVSDPSLSPTLTMGATQAGVILGTAAYMSPEQAHGRTADRRADIWSFGAVLYEMLSAKLAFTGESVSDTLAGVLKLEPDWNALPATTPAAIRKLLRQCLTKDRKQRLQAIGDARIAIDDYLANPSGEPVAPRRSSSKLPWIVAAALCVLLILALGAWWRATRPELKPLMRLNLEMGPDAMLDGIGGPHAIVSPDGTRLVYRIRGSDGKPRLATRTLDQAQSSQLAGTENGGSPFFSPDGQWIGFFADGKLKKILAQGGGAVTLCDAPSPRGGSWGDDGNIIAALEAASGLSLVSSSGGSPIPLTQRNAGKQEMTHRFPQHLPGGKAVLFVSNTTTGNYEGASIEVQSLTTGKRKTLQRGAYFGHYLPSGHLIYMRQGILFAAPLDLDRLELYGTPVPVLEDVPSGDVSGTAHFHFSQTGTVVYRSSEGAIEGRSISWLESSGKTVPLGLNPGKYSSPRLAPDGRRLAVTVLSNGKIDLWIYDLDRESMTRLTFAPGDNYSPVWTPDGKRIAFCSRGAGISWIRADGAGEAQRLTEGSNVQVPASFSPDGKWLAFTDQGIGTGLDIWTLPIEFSNTDNPKPGKPAPFLRTPVTEMNPVFSPDGRWLAYTSTESGTPEVYVRPFPGPGGKWQISSGGGMYPMWSPKAHDLFYRTADNRIMVATYTAPGDSFLAGKRRLWTEIRVIDSGPLPSFDLAPDGKRFAILMPADAMGEQKPSTQLTFLLNFFDELRRRVPVR
jgi:serine/threonine protein kinase/Tol biopolymer transport system component